MSFKISSISVKYFNVRKLIVYRATHATNYFEYVDEVGCDLWNKLVEYSKRGLDEPKGIWLDRKYILPGTSKYVQGVEVPINFDEELPYGFEYIVMPESQFLLFKSEPYDDEQFMEIISEMDEFVKTKISELSHIYDFTHLPYDYQLEPTGSVGYIVGIGISIKE